MKKKIQFLLPAFGVIVLSGCTSLANKDDVYLLKSEVNEDLAQIKTQMQRLQEQVQELSQNVDLVQKDTANQILNLSTEVSDKIAILETTSAQEKQALSQKMNILVDEVSRTQQKQLVESPSSIQPNKSSRPVISENTKTYTIRTGDSLSKIARSFGVSKEKILSANNLVDENYLAIGDVLVIPEE